MTNDFLIKETKRMMIVAGASEERILEIEGDLRNESVHKELVEGTVKKFGGVDILVCFFAFYVNFVPGGPITYRIS